MSKNKIKSGQSNKLVSGDIVEMITKVVNKRGKLKGNSGHETTVLKCICPHHKYSKKGNLKPEIMNDGEGNCICDLCKDSFQAAPYEKPEINQTIESMESMISQAKFLAVALDAGDDVTRYLAALSIDVHNFKDVMKKLTKTAKKQDDVKNKKSNKAYKGGSATFGAWSKR